MDPSFLRIHIFLYLLVEPGKYNLGDEVDPSSQ